MQTVKEEFNEQGQVIYRLYDDGGWENWKYDEKGNEIFGEDSDGFWKKFTYDANGREIKREYADEYWETRQYDMHGNLTGIVRADGSWEKMEYDEQGNQIHYDCGEYGAVHETYLNRKQINLIAAYEQYLDLSPQERVTERLGRHYFLKQGADQQQVDLLYKCGLGELKISEEVFLSDTYPLISATTILDRFRPRLGIFLTNAGAYASGQLQGEWLNLPADSETLQAVCRKIGIEDGGEYFITDYDTTAIPALTSCLREYENLNELNYLAVKLQEVAEEGNFEVFAAALELGTDTGTVAELINLTENLDCYTLLPEACDEESLGRYAVANGGYDLDAMGELAQYIDYEALGRDIRINEGGIFTEQGYIARENVDIPMVYEAVEDIPQEYLITVDATQTADEAIAENLSAGMTMM